MRPRTVRLIRAAYWIWAMTIGAFAFWMMVLGLSGCGSSSTWVMLSDGRGAWHISCRRSEVNCLEEAQDVCPRGYQVVGEGTSQGIVATQWGQTTVVSPTYGGAMLIRCRRSQ